MYKGEISVGTTIIIIQLSTHIVGPVKVSISLINQIKSVSLIADKIDDMINISNENLESESLHVFENSIKVNTTVGIIKIDGDELFIDSISDESIFIKGRIIRVEFI